MADTYAIVLKSLAFPEQKITVLEMQISLHEARQIVKRFVKAKWQERRPDLFTIDNVAITFEKVRAND